MLSSDLETSLNVAIQSAREGVHEFITVEHLLLALLDNPSASRVIRACGGDLERFTGGTQQLPRPTCSAYTGRQ